MPGRTHLDDQAKLEHIGTFQGVHMREADLTGASFVEAAVVEVDLSAAQLRGATFTGCDLRGSDLSALDPRQAELVGALINPDQAVVIARALGLDVR